MDSSDTHNGEATDRPGRSGSPARRSGALGLALLTGVAALFVAVSLRRYLPLDPARSLVALEPAFFPLLVAHVLFGSVAMGAACLQLWPRFRTRHPDRHRLIGRLYVFAGVLPAGVLALFVACLSPFGPVARASNLVFACVWLASTLAGWRAGRAGRASSHRRWMIRSSVLTFSVLTNRVWGPVAFLLLEPQRATTFGGDERFFAWTIAGLSTWLGWTLPLLVTEIVLEREVARSAPELDHP